LPAIELDQIVGAHQPNELRALEPSGARFERVGGKTRAEPCFERYGTQPRIAAARAPYARHPRRKRGHAALRLERILRTDDEPDFVEIESLQGFARDVGVAGMRWIERTAEQAHATLGRQAKAMERRNDAQGRVCPEPRSTYL
jgi:hypothetical protein